MRKLNCLFLIIIFNFGIAIYAQEWTVADSLWLQRVLNGKETIRLNIETQKAIESGTLIRNPHILEQLYISPVELPFIKSFENITAPESQRIPPHELPVPVYKLYILNHKDTLPKINKNAFTFSAKTMEELKALDKLTPRKSTVDDPTTLRSGSVGVSFEDIVRSIFWPSHRAKKRNAKNANAWKTYNEYE